MTDIAERLRSRHGATFLDETAAREIEALRRQLDEHKRALVIYCTALRPFAAAARMAKLRGPGALPPTVAMDHFATAAELVPEDKS
jgi:hypothetical protein